MSDLSCLDPIPLDALISYERGELDDDTEARVEEHYFDCTTCHAALAFVQQIGSAIARAVAEGAVEADVTAAVIERSGCRTYRIAPGGSVACTASPDDLFVAVWLQLAPAEDESVDVTARYSFLETGAQMEYLYRDVEVDKTASATIRIHPADVIRALPRTQIDIEARARGPRGERILGTYQMNHTPWEQLQSRAQR